MYSTRTPNDSPFPMNLSDEEEPNLVDSDGDDDDDRQIPGTADEGPYRHPAEAFMDHDEGTIYGEDGIQYQAYMEEQYENNQEYSRNENGDYINAHYIDENDAQRSEDEIFQLLENPAHPITTEERLTKFPEMRQLPAFRRPKRQQTSEAPSAPKQETSGKRWEPQCPATRKLLVASQVFPEAGSAKKQVVPIQDAEIFMNQPRLYENHLPETRKPVTAPKTTRSRLCKDPRNLVLRPINQMTPLPDRYFQTRYTLTPEQAGFSSECAQCSHCNYVFRKMGDLSHHEKKHVDTGRSEVMGDTAGMFCPYKPCAVRCDSIATIVQHMKMFHGIPDIPFETVFFKNMAEFKAWRLELERLTMSKFTRASGKQNVNSNSVYYQCQHSGNIPMAKTDELLPKQRIRQSKKMGRTCTAFFNVRENIDGTVQLRGCTKHCGHGRDIRQLPLTDEIKQDIAMLLIEGFDEYEVVEKMRKKSDATDRGHYLQNYEVRNVYHKVVKFKKDYMKNVDEGFSLPALLENVNKPAQPAHQIGKAKLSCSRYPVVGTPSNQAQVEQIDTTMDYANVPQPAHEEVIEEDQIFQVPELPTSSRHGTRSQRNSNRSMDELLEIPPKSNFGGRRRPNDEPPHRQLKKTTQEKEVAEKRKNSQNVDPEDEEFVDVEEYDGPSTSTAPPPTRYSSRLRNKH